MVDPLKKKKKTPKEEFESRTGTSEAPKSTPPAGSTTVSQPAGTRGDVATGTFRTTPQGDRFDISKPLDPSQFRDQRSFMQAEAAIRSQGNIGISDTQPENTEQLKSQFEQNQLAAEEEEKGPISKGIDALSQLTLSGRAEEAGVNVATGTLPIVGVGGGAATVKYLGQLGKKAPLTNSRNFIGRSPTSGVDKIFAIGSNGATAARYSANGRSIALSTGFLSKYILNPSVLVGAIGSYPFAGFIKEEALQTLSFGVKLAEENNDVEGMAAAIQEQEEVLDPAGWAEFLSKIPYANIVNELNAFYKAARVKLDVDKKRFEELKGGN